MRFEDNPDPGTQNTYAYELFQKGRENQLHHSRENFLLALELYAEAAALDPNFDRPRIAQAILCCTYYRDYSKNPKWLRRAESTLAEVYRITGETAQTLYVRGMIEWFRGNVETSERLLQQSIEEDPSYPYAYNILGALYTNLGRHRDAAEIFLRELALDESPLTYANTMDALDVIRDETQLRVIAERSLPVFEEFVTRDSENASAWCQRALALLWAGKTEAAATAADELSQRPDLPAAILYRLGLLYQKLGKPELYLCCLRRAIEKGYRELEETKQQRHVLKDPILIEEFDQLLATMQDRIDSEKALKNL